MMERFIIIIKNNVFRHLKLVLYSLQADKKVLSFTEDGDKPSGISVNHDTEDRLLPLRTDSFKLFWD